ncbi:MAG: ABC transporter ATP-binding protein [Deltaproteobacteria bacterium]|nr:ABC transporter ATP-binding protein [Deltaproteobacteria bacterium]
MPSLISVRSVTKIYEAVKGQKILALEGVSLDVNQGEFVTLVGPSGCGKSTLLRVIAGLLPATSGELHIDGKRISGPLTDVGMVFQTPVLMPWLSVLANMLLPIEILKLNMEDYRKEALELIQVLGLESFENAYPFELSGGMQSRVAIGRALIHNPKLLLMDEPFGSLDAFTRESMGMELLRIWEKYRKTVIFVTHDISEAVFLGDTVAVLTARPGRLSQVMHIDLERPRTMATKSSSAFADYTYQIRKELGLK